MVASLRVARPGAADTGQSCHVVAADVVAEPVGWDITEVGGVAGQVDEDDGLGVVGCGPFQIGLPG